MRLMRDPGEANLPRLTWHTWHDWRDYKDHDQVWNNVGSWHNVGYRDPQWQQLAELARLEQQVRRLGQQVLGR